MKTHISNVARLVHIPKSKPLLPLFEAIVNSMHSIDQAPNSAGRIEITLHRDDSGTLKDSKTGKPIAEAPITSIEIIDNGVGFNEENWNAFDTYGTPHKSQMGGKGVGRLTFLVVFERAEIESVFSAGNNAYFQRRFRFEMTEAGVEQHDIEQLAAPRATGTKLKLCNLRPVFELPKSLEKIAEKLCEHLFLYLTDHKTVAIILNDPRTNSSLKLNDYFRRKYILADSKATLKIKGERLTIRHVRLRKSTGNQQHQIILCANDRPVESLEIDTRVTYSNRALTDMEGNQFFYAAMVSGELLNQSVEPYRLRLDLPERDDGLIEMVTRSDIYESVAEKAKTHLKEFTESLESKHTERLESRCRRDPRFRALFPRFRQRILAFDPGLSDDQIEIELYKLYRDWKLELMERSRKLSAQQLSDAVEYSQIRTAFLAYLDESNEVAMADLAVYVVDRRAALAFLEKRLDADRSGRFEKEDAIHRILFPLRKSSTDVPFDESNLWILDERLAFHRYLASDKELSSHETLCSDEADRPDLAVYFDSTIAFGESVNPSDLGSVVLVELKRPGRDDYTAGDNPVDQVYRYMDQIRSGAAEMKGRRPFVLRENTPFHVYIVCDITSSLRSILRKEDFLATFDGFGYFKYHSGYKAYIEVISFDKLLRDAKQRNLAFFERLNLPCE